VVGPKAVRAGTTLCDRQEPILLDAPRATDPVVAVAVEPRRRIDSDRLASALVRLVEEDPSLALRTDPDSGQTLLSGLGELHLEVAVEKLRQWHGLEVAMGRPRVAR
jgi:elongation factor G